MLAYKTAVAVKNLGYGNIKIYNGGIKDWQRAELPLETIHPLPEVDVPFITTETFLQQLEDARIKDCKDSHGAPLITILDFRNGNFLKPDNHRPRIRSNCKTQTLQLDDLQDPDIRASIPRKGQIVTITETGNRDAFVIRYLSRYGFSSIYALKFGMRGWIKLAYPTEQPPLSSQ